MQKEFSLKVKLIVSFWLVLVFSLAVPSNYFIQSVEQKVDSQHLQYVQERMEIVQWIIAQEEEKKPEKLDSILKSLDFLDDARVSVLDAQGMIIADSRLPREEFEGMSSYIDYPEVVRARHETGYHTASDPWEDDRRLYMATSIDLSSEQGDTGYLRLVTPFSGLHPYFQHVSANLWKFVLLSLFLSCIVVYLMVTYLTFRLKPMIKMAQSIGQGNFQQRIQDSPGREFDPLVEAINRMAEDVEKSMELVSSQKSDLETIVNGIKDGLAALDNQGRIISCNQSFKKIFQHLDTINGKKPVEIFFNNSLQAACEEVLGNSMKQTRTMELEIKEKFYDVHVVSPSDQQNIGAIILLHDITDLKTLESIRKDFVANASHELRTPLTSIKGYTETMLQHHDIMQEKGTELLQVVIKNTDNMIRLLDDILQLSRIESTQDHVALDDVDLAAVIFKSWNNCSHYTEGKKIVFESELEQEGQLLVRGEAEYLGQVFQNLFENSIKFVPGEGFIQVLVRQKGNQVWVGVQDNGPGIPAAEQQRIFERFYRVKKDKKKVKGTGLGLAICKNIVKAFGGRIWVESPVPGSDSGCIVWFSLHKADFTPGRQTGRNA